MATRSSDQHFLQSDLIIRQFDQAVKGTFITFQFNQCTGLLPRIDGVEPQWKPGFLHRIINSGTGHRHPEAATTGAQSAKRASRALRHAPLPLAAVGRVA